MEDFVNLEKIEEEDRFKVVEILLTFTLLKDRDQFDLAPVLW